MALALAEVLLIFLQQIRMATSPPGKGLSGFLILFMLYFNFNRDTQRQQPAKALCLEGGPGAMVASFHPAVIS